MGNIKSSDLNIDIKNKNKNLIDEYYNIEKELEESKKITLTKLNYLFKYIEEDNAVEQFEDLKNELNVNKEKYNKILEYYYNITENSEKNKLLNEKNEEFFNLISQYKELIVLFKESEDKKYLKDAIDLYIDKIIVLNKKILETKYKINIIENYNETNYLIQKKYLNNEYDILDL